VIPGQVLGEPPTTGRLGVPVVGDLRTVDRAGGLLSPLLGATEENRLPDDVGPEVVVGVVVDEGLRLTGAEQAGRSYGVDQQDQPRMTCVSVERGLELLDPVVDDHLAHRFRPGDIGLISEQIGRQARDRHLDPGRLSRRVTISHQHDNRGRGDDADEDDDTRGPEPDSGEHPHQRSSAVAAADRHGQ